MDNRKKIALAKEPGQATINLHGADDEAQQVLDGPRLTTPDRVFFKGLYTQSYLEHSVSARCPECDSKVVVRDSIEISDDPGSVYQLRECSVCFWSRLEFQKT
jgi:hypothetical protein